MNEEIRVSFGAELGPLASGLRSIKGMVSSAAEGIKDSFKDAFRVLTAPLSIGGAVEAIHSLMEDVKNIKRISESTGLDTGITQDLLNLGKASGIAGDAIESAMDKFVKKLAPGSDPEQALYALADRMEEIKDPTERARLAIENFGKTGVKLIPILEEGSDGIKRMSEEWGKLTEAEIAQMEQADRTLEKFQNRAKVKLAQIIEGASKVPQAMNAMPWWKKVLEGPLAIVGAARSVGNDTTVTEAEMAIDNAKEAQKTENARKAIEERKALALKGAKELAEKEEFISAKPQEKILSLTRKILELKREMEGTEDEQEREKIISKICDLEEKRATLQNHMNMENEASLNAQALAYNNLWAAIIGAANATAATEQQEEKQLMPSLQQMADSGHWEKVRGSGRWVWKPDPYSKAAQGVIDSEKNVTADIAAGNFQAARKDFFNMEEFKKQLPTTEDVFGKAGPSSEDVKAMATSLAAMLQVMTRDGVVLYAPN